MKKLLCALLLLPTVACFIGAWEAKDRATGAAYNSYLHPRPAHVQEKIMEAETFNFLLLTALSAGMGTAAVHGLTKSTKSKTFS